MNTNSKKLLSRVGIYFAAVVIMIGIWGPFYCLLISSITPLSRLMEVPPAWIPVNATLKNYWNIISASPEMGALGYQYKVTLFNSFIIASSATVFSLFLGGLAAYAFVRLDLPFKDKFIFVLLFTQMIPPIVILIPTYMIARSFGLLDSKITLIILYSALTMPLTIWIMMGYFATLPKELEDAARVDGCNPVGTLFRIILPLSVPALFATGILVFLMAWNEFIIALILTKTLVSKTMPVAIPEFIGRFTLDYGLMCTVGVIGCIPPMIIALVFQKYILKGLTSGAVKG